MNESSHLQPAQSAFSARPQLARLNASIVCAAAFLPIPGPITAFAFLNTLQALEDLPFDQGMSKGADLYGCQPYLAEDKYREHLAHGRIRLDDLAVVLREELGSYAGQMVEPFGTRFDLRLTMLRYSSPRGPAEELRGSWRKWTRSRDSARKFPSKSAGEWSTRCAIGLRGSSGNDSTDVEQLLADLAPRIRKLRSSEYRHSTSEEESLALQVLWRICYARMQEIDVASPPRPRPLRLRDLLLDATGEDSDLLVHDVLVRFCAAFIDQGFAGWPLPHRDLGLFRAFSSLYANDAGPATHWLRDLAEEIIRIENCDLEPLESIRESCTMLGIDESEWDDFIAATLLALRGWAGMLWQMEVRPDRVPFPVPAGSLVEYLAVRLILERLALTHITRHALGYRGLLIDLRRSLEPQAVSESGTSAEQRAFVVFQLAQRLGWSPRAARAIVAGRVGRIGCRDRELLGA